MSREIPPIGDDGADDAALNAAEAIMAASTFRTRATLLKAVATGADEPWIRFERTYGPLIRAIAHRLGLRGAALDDVAQEAWLDLVRTMPDFEYDPDRGAFRGWLRQVVRRRAWRRWRAEQRHAELAHGLAGEGEPSADWDGGFDQAWDDAWRRHHLAEAMRRLEGSVSARDRAIFAATAVAGRTAAAVAEEFGISVDAVHQVRSRVMRRLRDEVAVAVAEEQEPGVEPGLGPGARPGGGSDGDS